MAALCSHSTSQCPAECITVFFFFLPHALFCKRKYIISGLFATRDTVTCHSKCKKKGNDIMTRIWISFFCFIFPPLSSYYIHPGSLSHCHDTWKTLERCTVIPDIITPSLVFDFMTSQTCPMKRSQHGMARCEWHAQLLSFKPCLNVIKRLFKAKRSLQAIILWE